MSELARVAEEAPNSVMEFNSWNPEFSARKKVVVNSKYSPINVHLLRVDAGVFPGNSVSFGCIFKYPAGEILFSTCKKESMNVDPLLAEMFRDQVELIVGQRFLHGETGCTI